MDERNHEEEQCALEYQDRIAVMSDKAVRTAYLASNAEMGDPWRDALAAEIRGRLRRLAFLRPSDLSDANSG